MILKKITFYDFIFLVLTGIQILICGCTQSSKLEPTEVEPSSEQVDTLYTSSEKMMLFMGFYEGMTKEIFGDELSKSLDENKLNEVGGTTLFRLYIDDRGNYVDFQLKPKFEENSLVSILLDSRNEKCQTMALKNEKKNRNYEELPKESTFKPRPTYLNKSTEYLKGLLEEAKRLNKTLMVDDIEDEINKRVKKESFLRTFDKKQPIADQLFEKIINTFEKRFSSGITFYDNFLVDFGIISPFDSAVRKSVVYFEDEKIVVITNFGFAEDPNTIAVNGSTIYAHGIQICHRIQIYLGRMDKTQFTVKMHERTLRNQNSLVDKRVDDENESDSEKFDRTLQEF